MLLRIGNPQRVRTAAAFLVFIVTGAEAQSIRGSQPLMGDLAPGPDRVGFRSIFRFDRARTWQKTRDHTGKFSPDAEGRPIQINVWYPAEKGGTCSPMTFGRYVGVEAPREFAAIRELMYRRNRENAASSVESAQLANLLANPMSACADAAPSATRHPLVLYAGGMNGEINSNVVLAEYLASHGYIVASVSLLGPSEAVSSQSRAPLDIEATVRDLEFALAALHDFQTVDGTRLAVMGHSLGAVAATVFAARNGNVLALIGLDGTYGFEGSAEVLTGALGFDSNNLRAALLDLRRAAGEQQVRLDAGLLRSFGYSERLLVQMRQMHHSDFTSFAIVARRFDLPIDPKYTGTGWDRRTAERGYQQTCRIVLEFLNEKVKAEAGSRERLDNLFAKAPGVHEERLAALPVPPAPDEAAALVAGSGLDAAKEQFRLACGERAIAACVDPGKFNSYGYELLGQKRNRDAVGVFEIVAWAHPTLANAQDSLADGYLAMSSPDKARLAILRAIELAATDATMTTAARDQFIAESNTRLSKFR